MVDYGNGVGQVAGRAAGGHGGGSVSMDMGAQLSRFVTDSAHTISTMPPTALMVGIVAIVLGLFLLKRAF